MAHTHLTPEQRAQMERLHKKGLSLAEIGRRLGRHETTIGRELRQRRGVLGSGVAHCAALGGTMTRVLMKNS
jgi:IS30 family transposase